MNKENNKPLPYGCKYTCFQDQIDELCANLAKRVPTEVPEEGDFEPVFEFTPNYGTIKDVSKYSLYVTKLPADIVPDPKMRYIIAAAYLPGGVYKADSSVEHGHKEEIIKILKDPQFAKKLYSKFGKLVEIIQNL